jgi:hypothetical protein
VLQVILSSSAEIKKNGKDGDLNAREVGVVIDQCNLDTFNCTCMGDRKSCSQTVQRGNF